MELLQFFVVCFFKGGFIIYVNLKYGLEVFFHGQFLIKILFEWKSCHGYLLILCVSCWDHWEICAIGKICAIFAEWEAVIKGLEVRFCLCTQTQGHSTLISAGDNFVDTSAVGGRLILLFAVEVLDFRSCKWRLQTICRQKSSLIEFRMAETPSVVLREPFSVLHFIWAEDRISQHCPQCAFRVGGCIPNVRGLLQGYRVLHLWFVMSFLPRLWKERPNNRESVTKTF